jgi:hypothetical protein
VSDISKESSSGQERSSGNREDKGSDPKQDKRDKGKEGREKGYENKAQEFIKLQEKLEAQNRKAERLQDTIRVAEARGDQATADKARQKLAEVELKIGQLRS